MTVQDRRVRWQALQLSLGKCRQCGREVLVSQTLGANCLRRQRQRDRKRGHRPWRAGRPGRPPVPLEAANEEKRQPRKRPTRSGRGGV